MRCCGSIDGTVDPRADAAADRRRASAFFDELKLPAPLDEAADLLLGEIRTRLGYLCEVGLGYLTLDRQSRTLSGGEVQRINLTTALGTSLVNTLFVLDEPSIGLHPRDMGRVIDVMKRLRDAGNSLVVVEHDPQIMFAADRILDMGPGPASAAARSCSSARRTSSQPSRHAHRRLPVGPQDVRRRAAPQRPTPPRDRSIDAGIGRAPSTTSRTSTCASRSSAWCASPACRARASRRWCRTCSTRRCARRKGKPTETPGAHRALRRRATRSTTWCWSTSRRSARPRAPIRRATSAPSTRSASCSPKTPAAQERGYTPGTFSFNSGNGRCPTCGGNGFEHVEMQFLSDVYLRCPDCDGTRYRAEVLEVDGSTRQVDRRRARA